MSSSESDKVPDFRCDRCLECYANRGASMAYSRANEKLVAPRFDRLMGVPEAYFSVTHVHVPKTPAQRV